MNEKTAYLYVNGLGDGSISIKDRMVQWWWQQANLDLRFAEVDWYKHSFDELEKQVITKVEDLFRNFGRVALIGGSAGGSLALNAFSQISERNVVLVLAHARLASGDYPANSRMSLDQRAGIGTEHASVSFVRSVQKAEREVVPNLSEDEKKKILNLTQLTDMVVDTKLMQLDGVKTHRSITFGHSGGYLAHLFADRDLISRFVDERIK
jgi:hypothetical protein